MKFGVNYGILAGCVILLVLAPRVCVVLLALGAVVWLVRTSTTRPGNEDVLDVFGATTPKATFHDLFTNRPVRLELGLHLFESNGPAQETATGCHRTATLVFQRSDRQSGQQRSDEGRLTLTVLAADPRLMTAGRFQSTDFDLDLMRSRKMPGKLRVVVAGTDLQLFTASRWDQVRGFDVTLTVNKDLTMNKECFVLGGIRASQILETTDPSGVLHCHRGLCVSAPMLPSGFVHILFSPLRSQLAVFAVRYMVPDRDLRTLARDLVLGTLDLSTKNGFLVRHGLLFGGCGDVNPGLVREDVLGFRHSKFLSLPEDPTEMFAPGSVLQVVLASKPKLCR